MSRHDQLWENYENALFALLMDEVAVTQGKEAIRENARLSLDESAQVPNEVTRRCLEAISQQFRKQKIRAVGRGTWAIIKKIPVLVMLCTFMFVGAFAASPEFRSNTVKFVMNLYPNEIAFGFETGSRNTNHLQPGKMPLEIGWVPTGFELQSEHIDPIQAYYYYTSPDGSFADITLWLTSDISGSVDTENASVENIEINGMQMILVAKQDEYQLIWADETRGYFLVVWTYGLDRDSLIKLGEGISIY